MASTVTIRVDLDGVETDVVLVEKQFSTGSRGFHANPKLTAKDGKRYQCNLMLVEIGSKNGAAKKGKK